MYLVMNALLKIIMAILNYLENVQIDITNSNSFRSNDPYYYKLGLPIILLVGRLAYVPSST